RRLGGSREVAFDVRVLAATNQDIDELLEEGTLREDLFYRLNVFTVSIPPLREHPEDVPLLAQHFIQRFNEKHETDISGLRPATRELLEAYEWPGNIRELRNVIERATILALEGWVEPSHLPDYVREERERRRKVVIPVGITAAEAERRLIVETLESVGGNRTKAAERLGLSPKTIYNKLKAWEAE
ncbi:MAG: helix-turn-helix domain-containing protein, partial [Gemmatimonadota bacterium]|nr:helix-turn-helix domain-containing protein [Gemmatimonadota bacterium]